MFVVGSNDIGWGGSSDACCWVVWLLAVMVLLGSGY
jgi:hypothetical protein